MIKFVVLAVLAVGCFAEEPKKMTFGTTGGYGGGYVRDEKFFNPGFQTINTRHFGGDHIGSSYGYGMGYGHGGYGHGYGQDKFISGIQYGYNGLGHQYTGGYGSMYGGKRYGSIGYGGLYGLGGGYGYYGVMPSYQYQNYVMQPVTTSYVSQTPAVHHTTGLVEHRRIGGETVGVTTPAAAAINFLTAHKSDVHQGVVQAAVHQVGRTVEYKTMDHQEHPIQAQVVEIDSSETPLHLHFKTKSSSVSLSQSHEQSATPEVQVSQSTDEPARLIHEIQKPVIQEVRELITPYRQVTQEINPVVEAVHTIVTKADEKRQNYVAPIEGHHEVSQVLSQAQPITTGTTVVSQPITTGATVVSQPVAVETVGYQPIVGYQHVAAQPVVGYTHVAAQPAVVGYEEKIVSTPTIAKYGGFGYGYGYGSSPSTIETTGFEPAKIGFGTTNKFLTTSSSSSIVPTTSTIFGGYRYGSGDAGNTFKFDNRVGITGVTGGIQKQETRALTH